MEYTFSKARGEAVAGRREESLVAGLCLAWRPGGKPPSSEGWMVSFVFNLFILF